MRSSLLSLAAGVSWLAFFGNAAALHASGTVPATPEERLQRMELRLNDLTDRLEQIRRSEASPASHEQIEVQPGAALASQGPATAPAPETVRPADPSFAVSHPLAVKVLQHVRGLARLALLVCIVFNLLLAIWIFTDIRKRGEGSGIFIALALVAGFPAAILYSLVRIGDKLAAGGK